MAFNFKKTDLWIIPDETLNVKELDEKNSKRRRVMVDNGDVANVVSGDIYRH